MPSTEGKIFSSVVARRMTDYKTKNDNVVHKGGIPGFSGLCRTQSAVIQVIKETCIWIITTPSDQEGNKHNNIKDKKNMMVTTT